MMLSPQRINNFELYTLKIQKKKTKKNNWYVKNKPCEEFSEVVSLVIITANNSNCKNNHGHVAIMSVYVMFLNATICPDNT